MLGRRATRARAPGRCTPGSATGCWPPNCAAASASGCGDLGPMRAARREDLLALDLTDRRFGYPLEMVVRAAEAGWRIAETAVPYYPREGKSKVTGTVRGTAGPCTDMRRVLASIATPATPPAAPAPHARPRHQPRPRRPRSPRRSRRDRRRLHRQAPPRRRPRHPQTGCPGHTSAASRLRASPPGARRAACSPRRSW